MPPADSETTFRGPDAPWPIRLTNDVARMLRRPDERWVRLTTDSLLSSAERRTRLSDWGDSSFRTLLAGLLDSVQAEGRLSLFGRFAMRQFVLGNLSNRLRVVETVNRFPEIRQQRIERPIFIVGWYRSGTTFLHNLMHTTSRVRAPLFWELRNPVPRTDPRTADVSSIIRGVRRTHRLHQYLTPAFETAHPMAAEQPEECLHLFENAVAGTTSFFISEATTQAWDLARRDLRPAYRFYRMQLQILQWQRPGRPWVFKWPYHLWHLDALLDVFPDAVIVHLHRDPVRAVPSICSLAAISRSSFTESIDRHRLGRFWLDYLDAGLERGMSARQRAEPERFLDVRYDDLCRDPEGTVRRIDSWAGLDLAPGDYEAVRRLVSAPRPANGAAHRYGPEQFGLDRDEIASRFADYSEGYV